MIAVEEVFDDWNAAIMRSLRRRFSGTPEATLEDGAAFAWAQFAAKRPPDEYAVPWLKLVARREVLALLRRWERPVQLRAEHGTSDTLHDQLEARELVRRVNELRSGQRVALTCRLLGLSYEEAMQATGHTYTWVNRHVTEGCRALAEQVAS